MALSKEEIRVRRLTPLMIASAEGDLALVKELVPLSIVDEADNKGNTALMYATLNQNVDIIRELIGAGANPLHKNLNGLCALAIAQNNQWISVIGALTESRRVVRDIYTHYDNLKVTRDAPIEVIRAAYKGLAQKYHPDKNAGDPNAARITSILNAAYEVLSDPEKRKLHDEWIAQQHAAPNSNVSRQSVHSASASSDVAPTIWWVRNWHYIGLGLFVLFLAYSALQSSRSQHTYVPSGTTSAAAKQPPSTSPSVQQPYIPLPESVGTKPPINSQTSKYRGTTGYLSDFRQIYANSLCTITVDNSRNETDVLVKVFSLDASPPVAVRAFAIKAGDQFTADKFSGGRYDVRYKDLLSGEHSKSEAFDLEVVREQGGMQYSTITMTLYKVSNGNMQTSRISATEFE